MRPAPFEALPFREPEHERESDPDDSLLGATLAGTYRIDRLVAEGGMGRLYAGTHQRLGMEVAVKVMLDRGVARPESIERAEREARAMAGIDSPHVARVIDFVRAPDGRPCMITELLHGSDLSDRLEKDGKLPPDEAARIARDVCLGLSAAHAKGILHRDIKPSNVFLTEAGEVKLLDFGVAKLEGTNQLTHAGAFIGTPAYMSPEQAASPSDVDERSEIYAVGAVLYHMLSAQPPYGTLDATQTLTRLLSGEPPRLGSLASSVPEGLAALVERAMSREPADRFATMKEFAAALEAYTGAETDQAVEQEARWLRPRAIIAVAIGALLAGLWAAAMAFEIGNSAGAFEQPWPDWALIVLRVTPALAMALAAVVGLRSLVARWRSAPRVEALVTGLRRTLSVAVAALGILQAARLGLALFGIRTGLSESHDAIISLAAAAVAGMFVAALGARFLNRRGARSADRAGE